MRLTTDAVLSGLAESLKAQISPALQDSYAIEATRMAAILATICANGADEAAAVRVEENAALRELFADVAAEVSDADLAGRLLEAAASQDPGLRISQLDAETGRLRHLLVELHAHAEAATGNTAERIDQRIWRLLRQTEMARAPRG